MFSHPKREQSQESPYLHKVILTHGLRAVGAGDGPKEVLLASGLLGRVIKTCVVS